MNILKKPEPVTVAVKGHTLVCPICNNNLFWTRRAQLNSAVSTFFKLDWTDRSATCFVCAECTHISWFLG